MTTPVQIDANRPISQSPSGPRTAEENSDIPRGGDCAGYEAHAAAYRARFNPQSPDEEFHLETMIEEAWNRRRYSRIEAALSRKMMRDSGLSDDAVLYLLPEASPEGRALQRVLRARRAATRAWERARREIEGLVAARLEAEMRIAAEAACSPQGVPNLPRPFLVGKKERQHVPAWRA